MPVPPDWLRELRGQRVGGAGATLWRMDSRPGHMELLVEVVVDAWGFCRTSPDGGDSCSCKLRAQSPVALVLLASSGNIGLMLREFPVAGSVRWGKAKPDADTAVYLESLR